MGSCRLTNRGWCKSSLTMATDSWIMVLHLDPNNMEFLKNLVPYTTEWHDETTDVEYTYEAGYRRMCSEMAFWVSNSSDRLSQHNTITDTVIKHLWKMFCFILLQNTLCLSQFLLHLLSYILLMRQLFTYTFLSYVIWQTVEIFIRLILCNGICL